MRSTIVAFVAGIVVSLGGTALAGHLFPDVPGDHPHAVAIDIAAERGVVEGYPDGTFRPNAPVTRGQVAAMLLRDFAGPSYTLTPVCGTTEFDVIEWTGIGSGAATVTYSIDGGPRVATDEIPADGTPMRFDAGGSGIVSLFVDGIARGHAPTAQSCSGAGTQALLPDS